VRVWDKRSENRGGLKEVNGANTIRRIRLIVLGGGSAAILALSLCAFVLASALDADHIARQQRFLQAGLSEVIDAIPVGQASAVIWDDAVRETRLGNQAWMEENLGEWMGEYFGFDTAVVLNQRDIPIHLMRDGETVDPTLTSTEVAAILPLVWSVRSDIAATAINEILPYEPGAEIGRMATLDLAGEPVVISVKPIVPSTANVYLAADQAYLHVAIQKIDQSLLSQVSGHFELEGLRLETGSPADGEPFLASNGARLGTFVWERERPAIELLRGLLPYGLGCGLTLVALAAWLLGHLNQTASRQKRAEDRAIHESLHDPLTGLPNRVHLNQAIAASSTSLDRLALHVLDIDWFRSINDTLGHALGDELLRLIAQRLLSLSDQVRLVSRVGGDEFAALEILGPEGEARQLLDRLLGFFDAPFVLDGEPVQVRCSIGSAVGESNLDRQELVRRANIALSRAKAVGRGRHVMFTGDMDEQVRRRNRLEKDLRRALKQGADLTVAYQPILAADGYSLSGAEALVRWRHPTEGNIPPDVFIEIAEDRGLIESLGEYVLRQACACAVKTDLPWVAVNVSPVQLRSATFFDLVMTVLAETGLEAHRLLLEITEGALLESSGVSQVTLQRLRHRGIRIALDDFGTGYSSMNYLAKYAVDKIKIDKSFVSQLATSAESRGIVKAILSLAYTFKLRVTAEGVETAEQRDHLAAIGCHELQGYLFSRPLAEAAFILYVGSLRPEIPPQLSRATARNGTGIAVYESAFAGAADASFETRKAV
jgi:diguanylate cyclase (GGDEF)-like protein